MNVTIRPATAADGDCMAQFLDPADLREIEGAGLDPVATLHACVARSFEAWTAEQNGRIVAMWGIASDDILGVEANAWLLTSPLVLKMPNRVARTARAWLKRQLEIWPVLSGNVDVRHTRALRWLEWLGFELGEPRPLGAYGMPFRACRLMAQRSKL